MSRVGPKVVLLLCFFFFFLRAGTIWDLRSPGILVFCSFLFLFFFFFFFFFIIPFENHRLPDIFNVLFIMMSTFQNTPRSRLFPPLIEMIQIFFSSCRVHIAIRDNTVLDTPPVPDNQHKRIVAFEDILKV